MLIPQSGDVLVFTQASRTLAGVTYDARREDCEGCGEVAKTWGMRALRDLGLVEIVGAA